jgi:antitoxin CptB
MSEADRIRWNCRRGLLELDLVLSAFLERHFDRLDARQVELFKELLDQPDNDLLDLVMGRAEPADSRCKPVLDLLRAN